MKIPAAVDSCNRSFCRCFVNSSNAIDRDVALPDVEFPMHLLFYESNTILQV